MTYDVEPEAARMAKKWYHYLVTNDEGRPAAEPPASPTVEIPPDPPEPPPAALSAGASIPSFDDIYAAANIAAPAHGYSILKIAEMLQSEHIASLPPEVKKKSVLLALDAAGVKLDTIIEDAVRRDRALDTFERVQERSLQALERQAKADADQWQKEIDALIAERQAKITAAHDSVAREAAALHAWRERKAAEEARIADAVGHFLPDNPITIRPSGGQSSSKS
jgi:hypothetical protein